MKSPRSTATKVFFKTYKRNYGICAGTIQYPMTHPKIEIRPEYSAQRRSHPTNIALRGALEYLGSESAQPRRALGRIADLGCGKLRHYCLLSEAQEIVLVDTENQVTTTHVDSG